MFPIIQLATTPMQATNSFEFHFILYPGQALDI